MKNKFEALKAFMNWPREWQELCAEFWASDDEPDQQRFTAADLAIAPRPKMELEPMPVRRAAAKTARKRIEYTAQESDYMDLLIHSGAGPSDAMRSFYKRFNSGHTQESLKTKYHKRKQELRKSGEIK